MVLSRETGGMEMAKLDSDEIRRQAQKELDEEAFKAAVFKEKTRILQKRTFWARIFPWRIRIIRV